MLKELTVIGLIPVLATIILHSLFEEGNREISYLKKQIIAGLVFGVIAIFSTEFSVPVNGALVNVRDASPLCAGLIFGPIAGIIAGLMGGIERFLCVYWGGGEYTRIACAISTIVTGFISAFLRKKIFEDKPPKALLACYSGIFCMTIHMSMIFLTHTNDIATAFEYIKLCAAPMITLNTLSVTFSAMMVNMIDNDRRGHKMLPTVTSVYQSYLIIIVMIGLVVSGFFTYYVQKRIAISDAFEVMLVSSVDSYNDVIDQVAANQVRETKEIAEDIFYDMPSSTINWLASYYNVAEIDVVNYNGLIVKSSIPSHVDCNIKDFEQLSIFTDLPYSGDIIRVCYQYEDAEADNDEIHYAGIVYDNYHMVITGITNAQFELQINEKLEDVSKNRSVGENGFIVFTNNEGMILSDPLNFGYKGKDISSLGVTNVGDSLFDMSKRYSIRIHGEDYYYMCKDGKYFWVYAFMEQNSANAVNNMSTYLSIFMQAIMYGILFILIYYITRIVIVDNINEVNESLDEITNGNLDTSVDVKDTVEFASLSDDINETVDALKGMITKANEKYDEELRTAKEIQTSSLPTSFPDRPEFELYALMDPAREVGGDFYDFYMVGSHTLVFLVADVSGKGIPASLFMMRAKTMIHNYAEQRLSPAQVLTQANVALCEGNDAGMFVTAWIGYLDLKTGELNFANAGHNPPLLRLNRNDYLYLDMKAGFVLAALEDYEYTENKVTLKPGDEIFLYTDGVVEATDLNKELYGTDRLSSCINSIKDENCEKICKEVKNDVENFYFGVDQFDDITELSLKFKEYYVSKSK